MLSLPRSATADLLSLSKLMMHPCYPQPAVLVVSMASLPLGLERPLGQELVTEVANATRSAFAWGRIESPFQECRKHRTSSGVSSTRFRDADWSHRDRRASS